MKSILTITGFAAPSKAASHFAMYLANKMKANVTLCNAIENPTIERFSNEQLKSQAKGLQKAEQMQTACPQIDYYTGLGSVTEVASNLIKKRSFSLVVVEISDARMQLKDNSQNIIDSISCPLLLIPLKTLPKVINKIAFASDFSVGDVEVIQSLVSFARPFNAEILIVRISEVKADQLQINDFLDKVTNQVNYDKIYYRHIEDFIVSRGLSWIAKNGYIDVFAMVHRSRTSTGDFFHASLTKELSKDIDIPLLVFQEGHYPVF